MTLNESIDYYVTLRRSFGAVFTREMGILRSFARALGDIPLNDIDPQATDKFCRGTGPPTQWWDRKHRTLRGFFKFLVSRRHLTASPLSEPGPRIPHSFEPYIYSRDELQRLLDATSILEGSRSLLHHSTIRTLLLTLYSAGLRPSEGLRLRCCDVDIDERVLTIWNTKFFKSRLVPIGTDLASTLSTCRKARQSRPMPTGDRSAFFASQAGDAIRLHNLEKVFARIRKHAGVLRSTGARYQPRLHDLRHTFAVHRLIAWYREGSNVQECLPLLSTYLGHVDLSGTQHYLTMTPDLLAEASKRFERYAVNGKKEENNV